MNAGSTSGADRKGGVLSVGYASLLWSPPSPVLREQLRALDALFRQEREAGVTPAIHLFFEIGTPAEATPGAIKRRHYYRRDPSVELGVSIDATLPEDETVSEFARLTRAAVAAGLEWLREKGNDVDPGNFSTEVGVGVGAGRNISAMQSWSLELPLQGPGW